MKCPRDHSDLISKQVKQNEVHFCKCCKGIWLPNDIVTSLLSNSVNGRIQNLNPSKQALLSCPNQCKNLHEIRINQVVIDVCSTCGGVWLDHGEIESILKRSKRFPGKAQSENGFVLFDILDGASYFLPDLLEAIFDNLFDGI